MRRSEAKHLPFCAGICPSRRCAGDYAPNISRGIGPQGRERRAIASGLKALPAVCHTLPRAQITAFRAAGCRPSIFAGEKRWAWHCQRCEKSASRAQISLRLKRGSPRPSGGRHSPPLTVCRIAVGVCRAPPASGSGTEAANASEGGITLYTQELRRKTGVSPAGQKCR